MNLVKKDIQGQIKYLEREISSQKQKAQLLHEQADNLIEKADEKQGLLDEYKRLLERLEDEDVVSR